MLVNAGQRRSTAVATLSGLFVTTFPLTVVSVILPRLAGEFHASVSLLSWAITGPLVGAAVSTPLFGRLGDIYGHRRLYLIGLSGATVLALVTTFSTGAWMFVVSRVVGQALASATQPTSLALLMRVYDPDDRPRATGWWSTVGAGAPVVGLAVGGLVAGQLGWRSIFVIQTALSLVALTISLVILPAHADRQSGKIDLITASLLTFGLTGALYAMTEAFVTHRITVVAATAAVSVGVLILAFRRELHSAEPLTAIRAVRIREIRTVLGAVFCIFYGYMGGFIVTPLFMESQLHASAAVASFVTLVRPVALGLTAPTWIRLGGRAIQSGPFLGLLTSVLALFVLALGVVEGAIGLVVCGNLLSGVGLGLAQPLLTSRLITAAPSNEVGAVAGAQAGTVQIASIVGISISSGLALGPSGTGTSLRFELAYVVAAAACACGLIPLLAGSKRRQLGRSRDLRSFSPQD